ncbi:hypothetical protein KIPB_011200 [Kipferlia bialata]|uniref:Uncharacterized protein n=1 Tax=Kipferlia bialata TaxID=797122 RepID=A0A9K3GMY3_9EUKA|nr:hypothetical protein KIPB_011200 [Kipferlia bialata]|eukprot:g11200.t1
MSRSLSNAMSDHTMRLWDANTNRCVRSFRGHTDTVNDVAFGDGFVASGSADHSVSIFDPSTGQLMRTLYGHGGAVRSIDVRDMYIASCDAQGGVLLHDVRAPTEPVREYSLLDMANYMPNKIVIHPKGSLIVGGGEEKGYSELGGFVWTEGSDGVLSLEGEVHDLALDPDMRRMAVSEGKAGQIGVYSII